MLFARYFTKKPVVKAILCTCMHISVQKCKFLQFSKYKLYTFDISQTNITRYCTGCGNNKDETFFKHQNPQDTPMFRLYGWALASVSFKVIGRIMTMRYRECTVIAHMWQDMMTSSNGNIFRVTCPLCGEFTGEFPTQRPVTRNFDVFFDLRLNTCKRLSKQSWGWWFETLSRPLWRHCNEITCHINLVGRKN